MTPLQRAVVIKTYLMKEFNAHFRGLYSLTLIQDIFDAELSLLPHFLTISTKL